MKKILVSIMIMCMAIVPAFAEEVEINEIVVVDVAEVEIASEVVEVIDIGEEIIPDEEQTVPQVEEYKPERHVSIRASCADKVSLGDTVTLYAVLEGYEGVEYCLQWQISKDNNNWHDISGANGEKYVITVTEENCTDYFRVVVISEE